MYKLTKYIYLSIYLFAYHDVMASIDQNGRRRFVASLKHIQSAIYVYIFIYNIDRRLHASVLAVGPFFVYFAPVSRSQSAVLEVTELVLVFWKPIKPCQLKLEYLQIGKSMEYWGICVRTSLLWFRWDDGESDDHEEEEWETVEVHFHFRGLKDRSYR